MNTQTTPQIITGKPLQKNDHLQMLRALAALSIFVYHINEITRAEKIGEKVSWFHYLEQFFSLSYASVDLFFVLSGFVIWSVAERSRSAFRFILIRFARIYSGYWPILALAFLLALIMQDKPNVDFAAKPFLDNVFLLINHNLFIGTAWTLSYELWFYVVVFFILVCRKNPTQRLAGLVGVLFALIAYNIYSIGILPDDFL